MWRPEEREAITTGTKKALFLYSIVAAPLLIVAALFVDSALEIRTDEEWHDINTRFDPDLGWSPIPGRRIEGQSSGMISTNALGYRSPPLDPTKRLIVMLGDSVTWGLGVSDQQTAAARLDAMVGGSGWQVQNMGVSGYAVDQYYLRLKKDIGRLAGLKRVVLIVCTSNDLNGTGGNVESGKRKPLFTLRDGRLVAPGPISGYCLRNLATSGRGLGRWLARYGPSAAWLMGDRRLSPDDAEKTTALLLAEIRTLAEARGARLTVVLSPALEDLDAPSEAYSFFKGLAIRDRYDLVDLRESIRAEVKPADRGSLYIHDSTVVNHYSPSGHLLVARVLHARIFAVGKFD